MQKLIFEGVRCFHSRFTCPLKPITLLVGENSSGKTTFLALVRIAWDIIQGDLSGDLFNEEPFLLGAYDQVASFRGGKAGRAKSFTIGAQIALRPRLTQRPSKLFAEDATVAARFEPRGAQSKLVEWTFESGDLRITCKRPEGGKPKQTMTVKTPQGSQTIMPGFPLGGRFSARRVLNELRFFLSDDFRDTDRKSKKHRIVLSESELRDLQVVAMSLNQAIGPRPYAFAPIRTRPRRTYDPLADVPQPEGTHVPMFLAKIYASDLEGWVRLRESLDSFGKASGLFKDVEIKRKGHKASDPFQVVVRTSGQAFNLVDVGYGVSQILPIIVDTLQALPGSSFLLQQPEVHLHPKAQAELGSFLATLAKEQRKRFIIETHSDYLVDRIRMDIRDKKHLSPSDVSILYFERLAGVVKIHSLEVDQYGNIVNAPPHYRQFFLEEERRLFEG